MYSTWCYTLPVKRALKTKAFARWCALSDTTLCRVAREIEREEYEADLGKDFSPAQEDAAKELAGACEKLTSTALQRALDTGILKEICNDQPAAPQR